MQPPRAIATVASAIARRPITALLVLLIALAPLFVAAGKVRPNNSLDAWFVRGDPALAQYHAFLREFGNDEAILVGHETPDGARTASEVALQLRIAGRLARIDGIERVLAGSAMLAGLSGGLVAEDGRAAALVAWLTVRPDVEQIRGRVIDEVRRAAAAELAPLGRTAHLVGNGVLYDGLNRQTMKDSGVFLTLALVAMLVLLAIGLRNWRAVILALVAPLLSAFAGMGIMGLSGRPFTVVGSALPTLILVVALSDAIHALLHYEHVRRLHAPADAAARRRQAASAVGWVAVPCLFTALTTAAGFASLATSKIALVRDFGVFAAAGMLLAWVVTLVFLTAALAVWDVRPPTRGAAGGALQRVLDAYAVRLPSFRRPVIAGTILVAIVMAVGALRLEADTDTIGLLPAGHDVRRDSEWMEQRLGAYTPLEMRVTSPAGIMDTTFLRQLRDWRARAEELPEVQRTFSALDVRGLSGVAGDAVPADESGYVSADERTLRVSAYVPMTTANGFARTAAALEREGVAAFGRPDAVEASGYLPLYVRITEYIVRSTVLGLATASVIVFALMFPLVRSARGMGAAMVVNLLPVMLVFGVMGWSGIPLDIATATVGAIVLGIVVDDTIHFLHRYRVDQRAGMSSAAAATETIRRAGRGMLLTSAVLGSGFAVMIAAGTKSISYFGLLAMLAVVSAVATDLLLLPVLLSPGRDAPASPGGPAA